jgi:prepilin signal peptidase PulO-like enzyme (type II secretory pathway)
MISEAYMFAVGFATALVGALAGLLCGAAILRIAVWLPKKMQNDWTAQCKEAIAEEPLSPVTIGKGEKITIILVAALLSVLSTGIFGLGAAGIVAVLFCMCVLTLSVIDLHTFLLPDDMTLPLLWAGLLASVFGLFAGVGPAEALIGAAVGYLSLWTLYWAFKLATGREGMGFGDFKLLAALGAFTGWSGLPMIALIAGITGLVVAIATRLMKKSDVSQPIPFGPYLALGGVVVFFTNGLGVSLINLMTTKHI